MIGNLIAFLVATFLVEPLQSKLVEQLAGGRAPAAVVQQVEACANPSEVPVVVYRRNGQPWRVCLLLEDFIPMMRDQLTGGNNAEHFEAGD